MKSWDEMTPAERLADWQAASEEELRKHVKLEGQAFTQDPPHDTCWRFVYNYPTYRLTRSPRNGARWTAAQWRKWYHDERLMVLDDDCCDRKAYLDELECDYQADPLSAGPVIIMEWPDGWDVGDGWHRLGIAFTYGMKYVPAIVGRLP